MIALKVLFFTLLGVSYLSISYVLTMHSLETSPLPYWAKVVITPLFIPIVLALVHPISWILLWAPGICIWKIYQYHTREAHG